MACLVERNKRYERDLQEISVKHEEELLEKEFLCNKYKRDLERALRKNVALEKEKKDFEDQIMLGVVPQINSTSAKPDSVDSSPELQQHKRPRMDSGKADGRNGKGLAPEQSSSCVGVTTAYTTSSKDKRNLGIMTKDPATIDAAPTSSRYDQAKATENNQAKATDNKQAKATDKNQAKAVKNEMDQDESAPIVTYAQKQEGLKMWKDLLIQTNDYRPFTDRTEEENLREVKFLRAAMSNFRLLRLQGMDTLLHEHSEFGHLQDQYCIPRTFCMPVELFRQEQLDYNVMYYQRCCSMYDFYNMLSKDNPCYVDRKERRWGNGLYSSQKAPPWGQPNPSQSERQESPAVQDENNRSRPPAVYPPGTSKHQAFRPTSKPISTRPPQPSYNPFIQVGNQPTRQDVVNHQKFVGNVQSTNPSNLDDEQRESADKAAVRRKAKPKNAPIPSDGDESDSNGESDRLFADKLLPADKQLIQKLERVIKRIKSRDYHPGYSREKAQSIAAAETDRLNGGEGPGYLAGVRPPWYSDQGQAPIHYDQHQVEMITARIERIKTNNTVACQLEYTANKGGPGGQARS